jgi:hypothetical protein
MYYLLLNAINSSEEEEEEEFVNKFKKGSRPFRKIISQPSHTVPGGGGRSGLRKKISEIN